MEGGYLAVARLKKPHGLKGDAVIWALTDDPHEVLVAGRALTPIDDGGQPLGPALVIERNDEQVAPLQGLQHPSAILLPGVLTGCSANGVAQGAGQAAEDGCLHQEGLDAFGLLLQDFFKQVIQHKMVAAGEGLDKAGGVSLLPY